MFLLSMLFLARFLFLISSLSSMLFLSSQSSCFVTTVQSFFLVTLYMIDLKAFHLSSKASAGISDSLSFSKASRSSQSLMILIVFIASFLIGILSFLPLCLSHSLVVDLIKYQYSTHHSCVQKV